MGVTVELYLYACCLLSLFMSSIANEENDVDSVSFSQMRVRHRQRSSLFNL